MPELSDATREALEFSLAYWHTVPDAPWVPGEIDAIEAALKANETPLTDEQWLTYFERLSGPEGCDFKEDSTWVCGGGNDKSKSLAILTSMGISVGDIERIHSLVDIFGGHCDCEILFNAAEKIVPTHGGEEEDV